MIARPGDAVQHHDCDVSCVTTSPILPALPPYRLLDLIRPADTDRRGVDATVGPANKGIRIYMTRNNPYTPLASASRSLVFQPALGFTRTGITALQERHHIVATRALAADVPLPEFSWSAYDLFAQPPRPLAQRAAAPAVLLISDCHDRNGRLDYAQQLMNAGLQVRRLDRS